MREMMHRLIDSFAAAYLEPMTRSELYRRMCMNLVTPSQSLAPLRCQELRLKAALHERQNDAGLGQIPCLSARAGHLMYPSSLNCMHLSSN